MALFNEYPNTNFHEMNLDWVIAKIKELDTDISTFKALNTITWRGAWNITTSYPAWSIVDNGSGNAYVSIKSVPAGISITNEEYWVLVANYSAIFADFQNRLSNVENEVSVLSRGDYYLFIGDSYATYTDSWVENVVSALGITSSQYSKLATSGTGFDRNGVNGFRNALVNYTEDRSKVTHIVVCGGANDAENRSADNQNSLHNAIYDFMTYAKANYVNASVYIGFIGGCLQTSTYYSNHTVDNMRWALYSYAVRSAEYGAIYLSGVENAIHTAKLNYLNDGLHPSTYGSASIGRAVFEALKGSYDLAYPTFTAGFTIKSPFTLNNGSMFYHINNDIVTLIINKLYFNVGQISFSGNNEVEIGTVSNVIFNNDVVHPVRLLCAACNGVSYVEADASLILRGSHVYLKFLNSNSSGYVNYAFDRSSSFIAMYDDSHSVMIPTLNIN